MKNELKPCPFCGDKHPTLHIRTNKRYILDFNGKKLLTENEEYEVACRICGCRTAMWSAQRNAIEVWNGRTEDGA